MTGAIYLVVKDFAASLAFYEAVLGIARNLTEIRFIQVFAPYWYFTFSAPDGNPIEVTGAY